MTEARILLFAKAPEPYRVKTRLIPALGAERAARLYKAMTRHCIGIAAGVLPGCVELWCDPDTAHPFFGQCAARWNLTLHQQPAGDIGRRMSEAACQALRDVGRVLVMGTDVPSIRCGDIEAALASLAPDKEAAIVPTEDGGYGLIGLTRHDPSLFDGIAWSSSSVMEQTRERLMRLGWHWDELDTRWDVDTREDVERLAKDAGLKHLLTCAGSGGAKRSFRN